VGARRRERAARETLQEVATIVHGLQANAYGGAVVGGGREAHPLIHVDADSGGGGHYVFFPKDRRQRRLLCRATAGDGVQLGIFEEG